jgi:hypothetical protein
MSWNKSIHYTITSSDGDDFDHQITTELNDDKWLDWSYTIQYDGTSQSFIAHIIFTQEG